MEGGREGGGWRERGREGEREGERVGVEGGGREGGRGERIARQREGREVALYCHLPNPKQSFFC